MTLEKTRFFKGSMEQWTACDWNFRIYAVEPAGQELAAGQ